LLVGRNLHPSNQAFGKWLVEFGFDDIKKDTRSDAVWMSQNWAEVSNDLTPDITHPVSIRYWLNAAQAELPPSPELTLSAPTKLTASIEQVAPQAKTINKLASMAERGFGQEKETALVSDNHLVSIVSCHQSGRLRTYNLWTDRQ
jgi:hypothetical protein